MTTLAWGARVSAAFRSRVQQIAAGLGCDPSWLMASMAFETGETFSPAIRNAAGSGAVGLIQFMPQTAAALGTTSQALAEMSAEAQLDEVAAYFRPWTGRLHSCSDVYSVILWPAMVGRPDFTAVFNKADPNHPKLYLQNRGLDVDANGVITKAEACGGALAKLAKGLKPGIVWQG